MASEANGINERLKSMKNVNVELFEHLQKIIDIPDQCVALCLRMSMHTAPVIEFTCLAKLDALKTQEIYGKTVTEIFLLTPFNEPETDDTWQCIGSFDCNAGDHSDACPQVGE